MVLLSPWSDPAVGAREMGPVRDAGSRGGRGGEGRAPSRGRAGQVRPRSAPAGTGGSVKAGKVEWGTRPLMCVTSDFAFCHGGRRGDWL